jgi:hypothetical protein
MLVLKRNTEQKCREQYRNMKKLALLVLSGVLLSFNFTASAETKEADKKWLNAVEKMVAKGESKVSTPSEERTNLVKTWGKENGYSVKVTKTATGFAIELSKNLAQK